jgi:hypothetical protein
MFDCRSSIYILKSNESIYIGNFIVLFLFSSAVLHEIYNKIFNLDLEINKNILSKISSSVISIVSSSKKTLMVFENHI